MPGLRFELGQEHRLEHEVPELLAQRRMVVRVDCLDHLVALFEHERLQRVNRLLAIPGAAVGAPQRGHNPDQARELVGGAGRIGHLVILTK